MVLWEAIYAVVLLVGTFVVLLMDWAPPDYTMLGLNTLYIAARIITVSEGTAGFSNPAVLAVAVLFVVAAGVSETGSLDYILSRILGSPKSLAGAQIRLLIPVMIASAFLNNTPIVAILTPLVITWADKCGFSPSKVLIPLSFASITGGTITLIGTSTNLVLAGLASKEGVSFKLFDIAPIGVPVAIAAFVYMVLLSGRLLPGGDSSEAAASDGAYLYVTQVPENSPIAGMTVAEAGLRSIPEGLYLASVIRHGRKVPAVSPDWGILPGDLLEFTGVPEGLQNFCERTGLQLVGSDEEALPAHVMGARGSVDARRRRASHTGMPYASLGATPGRLVARSMAAGAPAPPEEPRGEEGSRNGMAPAGRASVGTGAGRGSKGGVASLRAGPDAPSEGSRRGRRGGESAGGAVSVEGFGRSGFSLLRGRVRAGADIVGRRLKEVGFRGRFGASVVAIRRRGNHVEGKLGQVVLEAEDQLIMNVGPTFDAADSDVVANLADVADLKGGDGGNGTNGGGPQALEREFMLAMEIADRSPVVGKTVDGAGLRCLPSAFLVALERATGQHINAVGPDEVLAKGDVLWFAGDLEGLTGLRKIPGLKPHVDEQVEKITDDRLTRRLVQAVVAPGELVGKTVRDARFRTRFNAAIIAVHRRGCRLRMRVGDIELEAGDVLLMEAGPTFQSEHAKNPAFALVSSMDGSSPPRMDRLWFALAAMAGMLALYITELVDLFVAAVLASAVMLLSKCLSVAEARQSVKWDVIIAIASAFGVSAGLENSGVARQIADTLVSLGKAIGGGGLAVQAALYLATALLSNVIANNAAAALMFPIAVEASKLEDMDLKTTLMLIMMGASAAFTSPFGYQTNLMVYGAGGYKVGDFVRFGLPLQFIAAVVAIFVSAFFDWWWLISILLAAAAALSLGAGTMSSFAGRILKKDPSAIHNSEDGESANLNGGSASQLHLVERNEAT